MKLDKKRAMKLNNQPILRNRMQNIKIQTINSIKLNKNCDYFFFDKINKFSTVYTHSIYHS